MENAINGLFWLVGAMTVGVGLIAFIIWFGTVIKRVHRVARDYHDMAPNPDNYGTTNLFRKSEDRISETRKRLSLAERNSSNAIHRLGGHEQDYKHTKTAKAIKRDKKRKEIEEGCRNERDFRGGGDGM